MSSFLPIKAYFSISTLTVDSWSINTWRLKTWSTYIWDIIGFNCLQKAVYNLEDGWHSRHHRTALRHLTQSAFFAQLKQRETEGIVMGTLSDPQKPENAEHVIESNRLEDILQCSENLSQRIVVTSATYPYHVEWINSVWSKACGWRSDEILGIINPISNNLLNNLFLTATLLMLYIRSRLQVLTGWRHRSEKGFQLHD